MDKEVKKEYTIVENIIPSYLEQEVNEMLKKGWECQGGVSVIWRKNDMSGDLEWNYAQAMIRKIPKV